jgi:hypothetical protein
MMTNWLIWRIVMLALGVALVVAVLVLRLRPRGEDVRVEGGPGLLAVITLLRELPYLAALAIALIPVVTAVGAVA